MAAPRRGGVGRAEMKNLLVVGWVTPLPPPGGSLTPPPSHLRVGEGEGTPKPPWQFAKKKSTDTDAAEERSGAPLEDCQVVVGGWVGIPTPTPTRMPPGLSRTTVGVLINRTAGLPPPPLGVWSQCARQPVKRGVAARRAAHRLGSSVHRAAPAPSVSGGPPWWDLLEAPPAVCRAVRQGPEVCLFSPLSTAL